MKIAIHRLSLIRECEIELNSISMKMGKAVFLVSDLQPLIHLKLKQIAGSDFVKTRDDVERLQLKRISDSTSTLQSVRVC
jgi:hypothetical protein